MFLSDGDLRQAIESKELLIDPPPEKIDPTSIDLHLDRVEEAKIWDTKALVSHHNVTGNTRPEVRIANYNYSVFSSKFLTSPPQYNDRASELVQCRGNQVIVRTGGFVLWQTKEKVGTPDNATLICFVEGKSTRARAGILVHLTAPTIHSTWAGKITLEICNVGPFDLVLQEDDVIAQLTVARITSPPKKTMGATSVTHGQASVDGAKVAAR